MMISCSWNVFSSICCVFTMCSRCWVGHCSHGLEEDRPSLTVFLRRGLHWGKSVFVCSHSLGNIYDCQNNISKSWVRAPSKLWALDPCLIGQRFLAGQLGGQDTQKKQGCFLEHIAQKCGKAWYNWCRTRAGIMHFFNLCSMQTPLSHELPTL